MKQNLKLFAFLAFLAFALNLISCSKTDGTSSNSGGGTNPNTQPFTLINYKTAVTDTLIGTLYYAQNNVDFQFYGDVDATGTIQKVRAISFRKHNTKDTVYNATFDDNNRIKTLFITVNGSLDTSISKYSYADSTTIQSIYHLDANTQAATLRTQIVIDSATHNVRTVTTFGTSDTKNLLSLALNAVLIVEGYGILGGIAAVAAGTVALPAVIVGGGLILFGASNIYKLNSNLINNVTNDVDNLLLPSAGAAELDTYPTNTPYNSSNYVTEVDNSNSSDNLWHWCACQFNTGFTQFDVGGGYLMFDQDNYLWGANSFINSIGYIAVVGNSTSNASDLCGNSGPVLISIRFYLAPNRSTNIDYEAYTCNYVTVYRKSQIFTCNN